MPFYTYRITINITNSRRTWLKHNISDSWLKTLLMKNKNQLSSDISSFEKLWRSKGPPTTTKWDSRGSLEHCSYITITDLIILSPQTQHSKGFHSYTAAAAPSPGRELQQNSSNKSYDITLVDLLMCSLSFPRFMFYLFTYSPALLFVHGDKVLL